MKIAVIGATGLVGNVMLKVLEERGFSSSDVIAAASPKSVGNVLKINNKYYKIYSVEDVIKMRPHIALFSAGSAVSQQYAPTFAKNGCFVIDNSSQWRMNEQVPLIVPEINAATISPVNKIIANPNCSTIEMVMALYPLHKALKIRRVVVSTYQSVTGTGVKAVRQLEAERRKENVEKAYPHPIDMNVFPHGGTFEKNGYTSEEMKLVNETHKILNDKNIQISPTVVRVPVTGGHSESVNVELKKSFSMEEIYTLLNNMPGVTVEDNVENNLYPMPLFAQGKDDVFVGRIRRDFSRDNSLNMWIVADNLRKGAATNAVQIAQYLIEKYF
ncbi:MAG: aspartate-semialdehyde dehydrogenase [Bacteroidales bacterium]|jgi:aspartate-semialdehyde dehydrogenase|nr:aspartate-semialdehyde dehydrogenase [Bacteroidales bacterium]